MSYEDFERANTVVYIRSSVLGDDIALASNEEAAADVPEGYPVYLLEEFKHLYATGELHLDALILLHWLKFCFPATRVIGPVASPPAKKQEKEEGK